MGKNQSIITHLTTDRCFQSKNKQLKSDDMVTGQSTGFLGHPSPSKEAVSYMLRGRFEELPASTLEARTQLRLLGAALCSSSPWLMFRVNTYLPSTLLGRSPTATRPEVAGQEKWKEVLVWDNSPLQAFIFQ